MSNIIIDRRSNPHGKSLSNRQRFIKRTKEQIKDSIDKTLGERAIGGTGDGQDVNISRKSIKEPQFNNDPQTGDKDMVLPGNKDFMPGDRLPKPKGGMGQGSGEGEASKDGEGEDDFTFNLNNDEFVDILFDGLELPHMKKKETKSIENFTMSRAGYTNEGSPTQLNYEKSMINSLGRRIALLKPKRKRMTEIEERLAELDTKSKLTKKDKEEYALLEEELKSLRIRARAVSFIDPIDLRYNNYTKVPTPTSQAVVFFVMDVSASMGEFHKDIAKRFFMLLHLFISRKYKKIEPVFIRYHSKANECDEEEFFYSKESGGTVTSEAFKLVDEAIKDRYSPDKWNIYVSHASDGDNFSYDNEKLLELIGNDILPVCQYFSFIQIKDAGQYRTQGDLYNVFQNALATESNFIAKEINNRSEIYPIFREIFKKENTE